MNIRGVILAAGQGTRMRSNLPKVLHPLLGKPMIHYAIEAVTQATSAPPVLVLGHEAEKVHQGLGGVEVEIVIQQSQLGTAHALKQTAQILAHVDRVLVTMGDMPILQAETLRRVMALSEASPEVLAMLTVRGKEAKGFGRVLRDDEGRIRAVVEEDQATPEQLAIEEYNAGVYCFVGGWLWQALERIPVSPKGEYYLTDIIALAVGDGLKVRSVTLEGVEEAIGVNTRVHLAEAEKILRRRVNTAWMLAGVTLVDPDTTYISTQAQIGSDTVIWPNTYILGQSLIGAGCELGPNTYVRDCRIGERCKVFASVLEEAIVENEVHIGPFAHLRKGAHLAQGVHMGNFGEVKNAYLGPGTKMGHFSYIGDATVGEQVNIGAGTITCNFDGEKKNHTSIGARAFIGSDTMLVAPVTVGEAARTGAGAVVTKDVPPRTLAVGMPARQIRTLEGGS